MAVIRPPRIVRPVRARKPLSTTPKKSATGGLPSNTVGTPLSKTQGNSRSSKSMGGAVDNATASTAPAAEARNRGIEAWKSLNKAALVARRRRLVLSESLNYDWSPVPSGWTLAAEYDETDLGGLLSNHTDSRITGMDVDSTGTRVLIANSTDDFIRRYELSTPWDFTTGAGVSGWRGYTNPTQIQMFPAENDFGYMVYTISNDLVYSIFHNTEWTITVGDVASSTSVNQDTQLGNTGSAESIQRLNADGTALYVSIQQVGIEYVRRYELSTPYDVSSFGSYTELNVDSTMGGGTTALSSSMLISPDETYVLMVENNTVHLITMSTPGDISTGVVNDTDTLTISGYGVACWVNPEFTKFWIARSSGTVPAVREYNIQ